jgi:hypothetical protein
LVQVAEKTLALIDQVMTADQGASFRVFQGKVMPHMGDAFRGADEGYRSHMGASLIGGECARKIWYGFHWAHKSHFDGRTLRLFNRGHLEEARFIAMLLAIGVEVYQQDANGKQFRISDCGGHFGGSGDGVGIGVPDVPVGMPCLLEFKTHNDASFTKLKKEGVRGAKFEHYIQMSTYMRKMGLHYALYGAVNKNNDEVYMEIITLDPIIADQFVDRARNIIFMREAPPRISKSPGFFQCKWCDDKPVCHLKAEPEHNCRTCIHATPKEDGNWHCSDPASFGRPDGNTPILSKERQLIGCDMWAKHQAFKE